MYRPTNGQSKAYKRYRQINREKMVGRQTNRQTIKHT